MVYVVERAPNGWKASREIVADDPGDVGFELKLPAKKGMKRVSDSYLWGVIVTTGRS